MKEWFILVEILWGHLWWVKFYLGSNFLYKYVQRTTNIRINGILKFLINHIHRSIIIPAISNGFCEITNILKSDDVLCTINAFKSWELRLKKKTKKL